ncbi:MAG: flagellar hook-associated protein FlgK [Sporomusaceae bacterium]|nr:flagellar hook-associated protein FlgK [Sporomusaceae bacterium]
MGSTFATYSIAYSGMNVNQASLTATSHNLANVNTSGASKIQVAAAEKNTVLSSGASTGDGVSVASITRSRDIFLDSAYRSQNGKATYASVKNGNLEYMDTLLGEYDTVTDTDGTTTAVSGVEAIVEDFFDSWDTLSTDPSSETARIGVIETGTAMVSLLSELDAQLQQLQADAVTGVSDGVDRLNELAEQVAELNQQIHAAEIGGGEASYLRDQRDLLLDEMSSLADIRVNESNGVLRVTLGGSTLVNGNNAKQLVVEGDGSVDDPLTLKWAGSGAGVKLSSGSIKAYLEDADQSGYEMLDTGSLPYNFATTATSSISTLRQGLNTLLTTLAAAVNELSTTGTDLNGDAGLAFFTAIDDSQPLSISNIQVNPALTADWEKVVAGSDGSGDNTIANAIGAIDGDDSYYSCDGLSLTMIDFYKAVISWLGTTGDAAASAYDTQAALVEQIDTQRQSVSGISTDEEMSNMIMYQNAYAASARVMATIDSLVEELIATFD